MFHIYVKYRNFFICERAISSYILCKNRIMPKFLGAMTYGKVAVNGALCHVTAIFGLTLAGLVVNDIIG